jgi:D-alanine--D-alanine ligase
VTVGILEEEPLPVVEIKPSRPLFDYTAKYTPGQTQYLAPAPLSEELAHRVQAAGLRAHAALGCRHFSRVDLILTEAGQPVVLEVNTIPGLTSLSLLPKAAACAGLSYDELCERMVLMALEPVHAL